MPNKILKIFTVLILVLVIAALAFVFMPQNVRAFLGLGDPFGGMVLTNIYCTASHNNWIIVGPPVPRSVMLDPGSILYRNYQPFIGHWVLGLANAFEPCLMWVCTPLGCFPVPIGGGERVWIMGTS